MVICGAYVGSWNRFIMAMSLTIIVSEFSYLYLETPIRKGALRRWFDRRRDTDWSACTMAVGVVGLVVVISLGAFYTGVRRFDRAAGGADVTIDVAKVLAPASAGLTPAGTAVVAGGSPAAGSPAGGATPAPSVAVAGVVPSTVVAVRRCSRPALLVW